MAVNFLGNSDAVLRLFPLICGLLALPLFYRLCRIYLQPPAACLSFYVTATTESLIYYSSEVKQYSCDVLLTLILLWMAAVMMRDIKGHALTWVKAGIYGLVGAMAIWFSHPAVFVVAGTGIYVMARMLICKDFSQMRCILLMGLFWLMSFTLCYLISLGDLSRNDHLLRYWAGAFMPLVPLHSADWLWFGKTYLKFFIHPMSLPFYGFAAFLCLVGFISLIREKCEDLLILMMPITLVLLASGFHLYPFRGRMILFVVPIGIILIAAGWDE